jgi:hypothetical protein
VPSSYPVPPAAVRVSAGMIVAVPLGLVASPLKGGRDLGDGDRSALVVGGTGRIRTHDGLVFKEAKVMGAGPRAMGHGDPRDPMKGRRRPRPAPAALRG